MLDSGTTEPCLLAHQQLTDGVRPVLGAMRRNQQTGALVGNRDRKTAYRGSHHRGAAGLRLDGHQPKGLRIAGHCNNIGRPIHLREPFPRLRRQERDPICDP